MKTRVVQRPVKLIYTSHRLTVFCMIRLFNEKMSQQTLIRYVLNIVNNCKNVFVFSCIFFNCILYVPVDRRRNFDILSKRQNNKVYFTCQLRWVGLYQLHLYLYIYASLEFLLPTLSKFTIQYNKRTIRGKVVLKVTCFKTYQRYEKSGLRFFMLTCRSLVENLKRVLHC